MTKTLTVADELAFDALPDETRAICERIIAARTDDRYEEGFTDGKQEGEQSARDAANEDAEAEVVARITRRGWRDVAQQIVTALSVAPSPAVVATIDDAITAAVRSAA